MKVLNRGIKRRITLLKMFCQSSDFRGLWQLDALEIPHIGRLLLLLLLIVVTIAVNYAICVIKALVRLLGRFITSFFMVWRARGSEEPRRKGGGSECGEKEKDVKKDPT